jgi:CBS domain-containing protein
MSNHTVGEVMTVDPVTVTATTTFKELAGILVRQPVSGIPVLSRQGKVVGMIYESDLLAKEEFHQASGTHQPGRPHGRALRTKANAATAGELMTTHPLTVGPDVTVAGAARVMDRHHLGCLPVVAEDGKLAGVLSPRDLLRVFLRPDSEIRAEIIDDVLVRCLGTTPALVTVDVTDGVVTLTGRVERKSMLSAVLPAARAIDGVVDVEGQLGYELDDTRLQAPPEPHPR